MKSSLLLLTVLALSFSRVALGCCTWCDFCCPNSDGTREIRKYCCDGNHAIAARNAPPECVKMKPGERCEECCQCDLHMMMLHSEVPDGFCCTDAPNFFACQKCKCCMEGKVVEHYCNAIPIDPPCLPVLSDDECTGGGGGGGAGGIIGKTLQNVFVNATATSFVLDVIASNPDLAVGFAATDMSGQHGFDIPMRPISQHPAGLFQVRPRVDGKYSVTLQCGCMPQSPDNLAAHGMFTSVMAQFSEPVEPTVLQVEECCREGNQIPYCFNGQKRFTTDPDIIKDSIYTSPDCDSCQCPQPDFCCAPRGQMAYCRNGQLRTTSNENDILPSDDKVLCDTCTCPPPPPTEPPTEPPACTCGLNQGLGCGTSRAFCIGGYPMCLPTTYDGIYFRAVCEESPDVCDC